MLISKNNKREPRMKVASFRLDISLLEEFKMLCKKHKVQQSTVIKNALIQAIKELKGLDDEK